MKGRPTKSDILKKFTERRPILEALSIVVHLIVGVIDFHAYLIGKIRQNLSLLRYVEQRSQSNLFTKRAIPKFQISNFKFGIPNLNFWDEGHSKEVWRGEYAPTCAVLH